MVVEAALVGAQRCQQRIGAALGGIEMSTDLAAVSEADPVIEAVSEVEALKLGRTSAQPEIIPPPDRPGRIHSRHRWSAQHHKTNRLAPPRPAGRGPRDKTARSCN